MSQGVSKKKQPNVSARQPWNTIEYIIHSCLIGNLKSIQNADDLQTNKICRQKWRPHHEDQGQWTHLLQLSLWIMRKWGKTCFLLSPFQWKCKSCILGMGCAVETLEIFNPIYMHIIGARRRVFVWRWEREAGERSVWLLQKEKGRVLFSLKYLISHPPLLLGQCPLPPFALRPQPPPGPARPFSCGQAPFQGQLDTSNLRPPWQPRDWSLSNAFRPIASDGPAPGDDWKTHLLSSASASDGWRSGRIWRGLTSTGMDL